MSATAGQNLSASLEDYLEAIFHLTRSEKVARSKDIADSLDVAKPSVTAALRALAKKKLVNYKPYGYVTLTARGLAAAEKVAAKHDIIKSFFTDILGIEAEVAGEAACKAEHALGAGITERLSVFVEFVTDECGRGHDLSREFTKYYLARYSGQSEGDVKA